MFPSNLVSNLCKHLVQYLSCWENAWGRHVVTTNEIFDGRSVILSRWMNIILDNVMTAHSMCAWYMQPWLNITTSINRKEHAFCHDSKSRHDSATCAPLTSAEHLYFTQCENLNIYTIDLHHHNFAISIWMAADLCPGSSRYCTNIYAAYIDMRKWKCPCGGVYIKHINGEVMQLKS